MAVSNNSFKSRRTGVAIASTIALALGGAALVPPSSAAAADVRYTDAADPVAPKASDLNGGGQCVVKLTNIVSSNSGLSYESRVPVYTNPKDRNFGLQVTANTSGERTFNYLGVQDNPENPPISSRAVTLPPLQPDQTIGGVATGTVNYVEDVPGIVIPAPERFKTFRKITTGMDLTEGQVDQIANGGMTIGWKGVYNADFDQAIKTGGGYLFDNGTFKVNGVVNPWPSENADCSPITIDWADNLDTDDYEATVIQPGETVKVGTVSADEDSLERLRFTAKDPKGNVVPGEITRQSNDIYWTMAEYRDGAPPYTKTDEITFEMIALPRDLDGLKAAAEANGSLPETVYDSSLAPERYRSAETIATNTFDIDDAKNHDPNYDPREQQITSGVVNNAPNEERQTRTFTNVKDSNGDTLPDLVKKYNARIELDDANVYDGWDAYFRDPENGDYTVVVESPAGTEARPGSFAQPIVKVTYSNGTQDIIPVLVIVEPNNTQTTDVVYPPETVRGLIGEEMKSAAPTLKRVIGKNQKPVTPASYTVDPGTIPADWTIEVAPDGTVTATSPADAKAGDMARPKIIATYPDGTIDEREVTFLVGDDASLNNPTYPVEVTKPGVPVTHKVQNAPEGTTFTLDNDEVDGWTYSIDPNTGAVTVTPPAEAQGGDKKANKVTVTYPDGTTDVVSVDTVVAHSFNYEAEPHYPQKTAYPGEQITSPLSVDKPDEVGFATQNPFVIVPGANFTATGANNGFGNPIYTVSTPNGNWTVSLDDKGNVLSQIPETAKEGDMISVPVKVTYEDNSTDETEAVIQVRDNPTRQVPFDVEYKYDPTLAAGTYEVETEGVAGEEKQQRDGTWKRTAEPTNEVVRVGTKPAEATSDVTWTAPIPYSTTTRPNPALAPGEQKVVQQGVNGERTYTAKFTSTGDQASVVESEDTKQPVEEIIEYGPRLGDQELVTETTRKIPFETTIVYDDTLEAGTQVVDKQGVVGEETVTSKQKLVDGKPSGDPVVETTTVTAKQDAVIRVGTKTEGSNTVEHTEPVPYETKVEYDPTLAAGEYKVVTPGQAGEKSVKVTETIVNSKVTDTKREEKVTTEPTTEVIKVGTKQATATDKVEWKEPIPFSTVVRPNSELKPGEVVTVQEGVNGEATYTATFEGTNGQATVTESKNRTEPTDRIVEYGPTIADQTLTSTTTNPVPFNTTFVADPNLPAGEQVVDKQGENGVDTVTATQEIKDGKPVGEPKVTTERTKEPVDAVVRVGTKTEGQTVNTYEAEIPFPVRVVYDPSLAPGESKVTQEGKPGTKQVTITQPVVNSAPNGEATVSEKTVTEPTEQIVTVGTKPDEATNTVTWTAQVPYNTVVRANTELKPGEVRTVQGGEYGEKTYTADFSSVGADSKVETKEQQTKEPKDQIIEYGPTIDDQTLKSETTRPIEFETEFILDDTLAAGEQKVDQQGENGEEKITSTQEIKDGKPVGEPKITTEVTKPAKKAIIRVGTKPETTTATTTASTTVPTTVKETETQSVPTTITTTLTTTEKSTTTVQGKPTTLTTTKEVPTTITTTVPTTVKETETATTTTTTTVPAEPKPVSETVKLPFTKKIVFDPALEPGQEVEDVAGVNGQVKVTFKDGKATVETVKEPVQRVVRVGSKPADGVEWTEETPYTVKVEEDPTLEAGKYVVAQEGVPGKTVHHADGTETKTPAKDHIIKVGTKNADSVKSTFKAPIPAPVVIEYDPTLSAGTTEVADEGKDGEKEVTVTRKMVNGQPTGDPVVEEEVLTEARPKVIKVGTKQPEAGENVTWTEPIPFTTEFRENPALKPGETKVVQEGKDGEATYKIEFNANGEAATVEQDKQRVEPVNRIIEYGPSAGDDEISSQVTRPIEFKTSVIYDDTLEEGKQEITQGELGEEVVTTTQKLVDGKPSGDPVTTTQQTKAPKNAVIRIGTKKPGAPEPTPEVSQVVDLPFTTRIVHDPTLEPGQEIEDVAGVNGQVKVTVVNGRASVETVREPVQRVVRVGTKPADGVEWTEQIPFKVEVKTNPRLKAGEYKVLQEGKPGLTQHNSGGQSEVISEPVPHVIEIGVLEQIAANVMVGEKVVVPIPGHKAGNEYKIADGGALPAGWTVNIDPLTGKLTVTTPPDARPGDEAEVAVDIVDSEGNERRVIAKVLATKADAEVEQPTTPAPEPEDGSSAKAKQTAERCFGNAVRSPILWLLPIGILGAVGGKVLEPHMAAINQQFGEFNAEINRRVQESMPDFGFGGHGGNNEQINQLMAQVDAANRQLQALAGDPNVQMIGKVIGAVAALAAISGVLYDWCSADVGKAKTAIDFGEGSSSRR